MSIVTALQDLPNVRVILSDNSKTICSVRITVARTEKVESGSMMFHHPRYITFGQTVVFSAQEVDKDQGGALFFNPASDEEALSIIQNINEYIPHGKDKPVDSEIIEETP